MVSISPEKKALDDLKKYITPLSTIGRQPNHETSSCNPNDVKWFAKPPSLSFTECARHGWINTSPDSLQCVTCKAMLVYHLSPILKNDQKFVKKYVSEFHDRLQAGHREFCPWRSTSCPVSFGQVPLNYSYTEGDSEDASTLSIKLDFLGRLESLFTCANLPDIHPSFRIQARANITKEGNIAENLPLHHLRSIAGNSNEGVDLQPDTLKGGAYLSAIYLALCGWKSSTSHHLICVDCQRLVPINSYSLAEVDEDTDEIEIPFVEEEIDVPDSNEQGQHPPEESRDENGEPTVEGEERGGEEEIEVELSDEEIPFEESRLEEGERSEDRSEEGTEDREEMEGEERGEEGEGEERGEEGEGEERGEEGEGEERGRDSSQEEERGEDTSSSQSSEEEGREESRDEDRRDEEGKQVHSDSNPVQSDSHEEMEESKYAEEEKEEEEEEEREEEEEEEREEEEEEEDEAEEEELREKLLGFANQRRVGGTSDPIVLDSSSDEDEGGKDIGQVDGMDDDQDNNHSTQVNQPTEDVNQPIDPVNEPTPQAGVVTPEREGNTGGDTAQVQDAMETNVETREEEMERHEEEPAERWMENEEETSEGGAAEDRRERMEESHEARETTEEMRETTEESEEGKGTKRKTAEERREEAKKRAGRRYFQPLEEHRYYCPWRSTHNKEPTWLLLMRSLLSQDNRSTKKQTFDRAQDPVAFVRSVLRGDVPL
ncbi:hypothetical protein PROFUN_02475 [Planoprotostelium fungivorum]|uniref:C3HC-type domain-containing protein n=1 Tax=Planoprotostelium fungivorum TaxID=1890364 RepID=A0A2P6MP72_9EUKA|nr:hypothetical protein PROFUN_02475 [Planoprotostelium fungivorum]